MSRGGPSKADAALIAAVGGYGHKISQAQLERWRRDGIVQRNERRGRGQGVGSTSRTPDGAVEAAAAMARFSQQGQVRHVAILRWFGHVGLPLHGTTGPVIPEPPEQPVRQAMIWFERHSGLLAGLPPVAPDDDSLDRMYAQVQQRVDRTKVPDPLLIERARMMILSGQDLPGERERVRRARASMVQTLVARAAGVYEIGADIFIDSLVSLDMLPVDVATAIRDVIQQNEFAGQDLQIEIDLSDGVRRIKAATASQLREARDTARRVLSYAAMIQMLGMAAPDLAPLNAAAATFRRYGLGILLRVGLAIAEPANLVPITVMMLDPTVATIASQMLEELGPKPFGDVAAQLNGMIKNLKAAAARPS